MGVWFIDTDFFNVFNAARRTAFFKEVAASTPRLTRLVVTCYKNVSPFIIFEMDIGFQ